MAVPVFEGKKCPRLDSNLNLRYGMSSSSASPLERFAVAWDVSSIESSDERIEVPQFSMAITFKRETSAQIEEGLTCALCRAVISGSSVRSLL